jgi:hypothetical protein
VYVSRVFRAENDNLYKFGIAKTLRGPEGNVLGVLVATVTTNTTMGQARLQDERRKAVLVGPLDTNPPHEDPNGHDLSSRYMILIHPSYHRGDEAAPFPDDKLRFMQREQREAGDDAYADPIAAHDATYSGRWLAGFAPVGDTEFMVIIQERYGNAVEATVMSFWELGLWTAGSGAFLIIIVCGGIWLVLWRTSLRKTAAAALKIN